MKIAIVGLGSVGLPLALQFTHNEVDVPGVDVDESKITAPNAGKSHIKHIEGAQIAESVKSGALAAEFSRVSEVEAVIICAPTALNKNREPDVAYILNSGRAVAPHLRRGTPVALESSIYPGTIDGDLRQTPEAASGLTASIDCRLVFSPEREDPGNPDGKVAKIRKVPAALIPQCLQKATEIYSKASIPWCRFPRAVQRRLLNCWKIMEATGRSNERPQG